MKPLSSTVAMFLKAHFENGASLPTFDKMAELLRVSHGELRESIFELIEHGVLEPVIAGVNEIRFVGAPEPVFRSEGEIQYGIYVIEEGDGIRTFVGPISSAEVAA